MSITRAFDIARTGLELQETSISVKAQNLAAQSAQGFKSQYVVATDLPYQDSLQAGTQSSAAGTFNNTGLAIGLGVRAAAIYRDFSQGDLIPTGNAWDMAINGPGFFQIQLPDGTIAYTRNASFEPNQQGQIVTIPDGNLLIPNITVPVAAGSPTVTKDGVVSVTIQGQTNAQVLAQLQLTTFINPNGLEPIGSGLYVQTSASGDPVTGNPNLDDRGTIQQQYQETSNVNAVAEITDLIKIQKAYEQQTKVLKTGEAMLQAVYSNT